MTSPRFIALGAAITWLLPGVGCLDVVGGEYGEGTANSGGLDGEDVTPGEGAVPGEDVTPGEGAVPGEGESPGEGEATGEGEAGSPGEGEGAVPGEGPALGEGEGAAEPVGPDPPAPMPACTSGQWELSVGGSTRQARVDLPGDLRRGSALVIALHGNGDAPDNFCLTSEVCADVTGRGAISIAPHGPIRDFQILGQQIRGAWHAYSTDPAENEDLALLDALVEEARERCEVGDVYTWGHSQGGYLAFLHAMARGDDVSGAVISAASDSLPGTRWPQTRPRPFFLIVGDRDPALGAAQTTATQLEAAGHRVSLRVLPGVGHGGHPRGFNDEILDFLVGP